MLRSLCNKRGLGLIEVVIAMFLTTIGIMAILSLQPSAWRTAARSDYLGRGSAILQRELESRELFIMNPCNVVTVGTTATAVLASDQAVAIPGDAGYNVTTTITNVGANLWRVNVQVTWPTSATGITGILIVSAQERYRFPEGCI